MNDRCPACGLRFNREPGYFLGAMYISYGMALALIFVFGAILWWLTTWSLTKVAIWAIVLRARGLVCARDTCCQRTVEKVD